MLKFGFTIYSNRVAEFGPIARHAEALGFERVWIGDHIVAPVASDIGLSADIHKGRTRAPVVASDNRFYDLWTMVGAVAASTTTLKVCTGIILLPLRHPLTTARACVTAHQLTNGRFSLGVGPGWLDSEFQALGVPFNQRGALTDEGIAILQKTLAGGPVSHDGPAYPFPALEITDTLVDVPLIVGGISKAALARAARVADGWVAPKIPFDKFLDLRTDLERMRGEMGTQGKPFGYHLHMPRADAETVRQFEDAGLEYACVVFDDIHPEDPRETTLDTKFRCLEATAKRLGLKPA
jgi:probable F420-dependent oxidoreductase